MGHSRQDGGFAEAPAASLEGNPLIPIAEGLGPLCPEFLPLESFTPVKSGKSDSGRRLNAVSTGEFTGADAFERGGTPSVHCGKSVMQAA